METRFKAQPKVLSLSECEQLTGRWSRDVEILARQAGWHSSGLSGERIRLPLPNAINMLILSDAMKHSVEAGSMGRWLPGLRHETLLKLGADTSNWSYQGPSDKEQQFWPKLYGDPEAIRPGLAPLLGCDIHTLIRRLRVHSLSDVECLTNAELDNQRRDRIPLLTIDAHELAARIEFTCGYPLFTVTAG